MSEDYLVEEPAELFRVVHAAVNAMIGEQMFSGAMMVHEWAPISFLPEEMAQPHVHGLILSDSEPDVAFMEMCLNLQLSLAPWRVKTPWVVKVVSEAHLHHLLKYQVKPVNFVDVYKNSMVVGVDMEALNAAVTNAVSAFEHLCEGRGNCGISYLGAFHQAARAFVGVSTGRYGEANRKAVEMWKHRAARECFDEPAAPSSHDLPGET